MNESTKPARTVLLGAGGHAGVLLDALTASGARLPEAIVDADQALWNQDLDGIPIVGGDEQLGELHARGVRGFLVGIGSARDTSPRQRLFEWAVSIGLEPVAVIHPQSILSRKCQCGPGLQLLAGAIVGSGATIGCNVLVNTGAIVEHGCRVEDHVHIATGARLCGQVKVGLGAHVGAGAVVIQGVTIGRRAVVGAGAVVVRDVAEGQTVMGVPARTRSPVHPSSGLTPTV